MASGRADHGAGHVVGGRKESLGERDDACIPQGRLEFTDVSEWQLKMGHFNTGPARELCQWHGSGEHAT